VRIHLVPQLMPFPKSKKVVDAEDDSKYFPTANVAKKNNQ